MYRILIHKTGMAKDAFVFYTKGTEIYEEEDLNELAVTYQELLQYYTTSQLQPVQILDAAFNLEIVDPTGPSSP